MQGVAVVHRHIARLGGEGHHRQALRLAGGGQPRCAPMRPGQYVELTRVRGRGVDLRGLPSYRAAKQGVALSPQGRMILPHLTVNENLLLGAACRRKGPWTVDKVFALFPILRERRHVSGTALSGGQPTPLLISFQRLVYEAVVDQTSMILQRAVRSLS